MKKLYIIFFALFIVACKKENQLTVVTTKTKTTIATSAQLTNLEINGASCGLDSATNTFYFPVSSGSSLNNYTVNFDTSKFISLSLDNISAVNGAVTNYALTTNQQVKIQAVDKLKNALSYTLIITGLPIVELSANQLIADDQVSANFNLIDPDFQAQNSQLKISSKIMISIRGNISRTYPKKSYLVHLVDTLGNDSDVSLLGLRTDNSWILDAMYIDQARMRNRVCTDVWNSMNNVPYLASEPTALNGTRGYMAEVFLNNKYNGVYCLTEKLDRKQLQIKKSDGNMYKATDLSPQTQFAAVTPFDNTSETWGGWELEYPDIGDTPAPNWQYLYNIANFVSSSTNDQFTKQIAKKVNLSNMVDYYLFMNILEATDNESKNFYMSFYSYKKDSTFFYSVWDLDGTLGRDYDGRYLLNHVFGPGNNMLFYRLINLNPGNFRQLLQTRWNALKNNQLSKSTVAARIEAYRKILVNTNAFTRERVAWATSISQDLNTEASYITSWYSLQYDLMDNYINNSLDNLPGI